MSAQMYLARLIDEGRTDRGVNRTPLRRRGLTRHERRIRRELQSRKG